ncbi:hypothetical protein [Oceanobacter kriegii]|uniref:hypothetical protein n=1 Tax=Oceanobacter kriegii TaxID=64972 RepID=UPI00041A12BF|nr:hypothetical protein [Oceanobacter kriegii]
MNIIAYLSALLITSLAMCGWLYYSNQQQADTITTQAQTLASTNAALQATQTAAAVQQKRQQQLQTELDASHQQLQAKQQQLNQLKENDHEVQDWARQPVPAGIVRLQQRTGTTTGAGNRHQPLSDP